MIFKCHLVQGNERPTKRKMRIGNARENDRKILSEECWEANSKTWFYLCRLLYCYVFNIINKVSESRSFCQETWYLFNLTVYLQKIYTLKHTVRTAVLSADFCFSWTIVPTRTRCWLLYTMAAFCCIHYCAITVESWGTLLAWGLHELVLVRSW